MGPLATQMATVYSSHHITDSLRSAMVHFGAVGLRSEGGAAVFRDHHSVRHDQFGRLYDFSLSHFN